jgi:outer membrane usher protein
MRVGSKSARVSGTRAVQRGVPHAGCRHAIGLLILSTWLMPTVQRNAQAAEPAEVPEEIHFDRSMLRGGASIDMSVFDEGNRAVPGQYRAELYVNQEWKGRVDVTLRAVGEDMKNVQPCFDRDLLDRAGVDLMRLNAGASGLLVDTTRCTVLPDLLKDARASFDSGEQRLDLSVPQAAMLHSARGYVDPHTWDDGVTAARLAYTANVYRSDSSAMAGTQTYVGINAGFNVGPWRLTHIGSYSNSSSMAADNISRYQNVQTSLERAIEPLDSRLLIGDAFTDGTMFDSVGFRGIQMATDDRMMPDSQRGYAPVVRGIASSNARVQIRQNGNILYETTVPPGAFEINDLYPTGYGGDLEVLVTEADGSVHVSRIPYAAVVNAVREGANYYSIAAGLYRDAVGTSKAWLAQGTFKHGFSNLLTGYAGMTAAEGYAAAIGGASFNTRWGALGVDMTEAVTQVSGASQQGQSLRVSYSKVVPGTNTSVSLSAYRYLSQGYFTLQDAMALRDSSMTNPYSQNPLVAAPPVQPGAFNPGNFVLNPLFAGLRSRSRAQLTLNQPLPAGYGSFYFSGSSQNYWNRSGRDTLFEFGYNNAYGSLSYGVSISREYNLTNARLDNRFMLMVSIPLGTGAHAPYTTASVQKDSQGNAQVQDTVGGTLGDDNAFNYNLSVARTSNAGAPSSIDAGGSANYVTPMANVGVSASRGTGYSQAGLSASGGIVAYSGGVAFTPMPGQTEGIIEAADAVGARVVNGNGLRVDPWGHAVVGGLTPFARNQIEIDPKGLPLSVELKSTAVQTAPTAGAVVRAHFETANPGRAAVVRLLSTDGRAIPFGAQVSDDKGTVLGTVAQGGRVLLRGLPAASGTVTARWASDAAHVCLANYALPERATPIDRRVTIIDAICRDVAEMPGDAGLDR